MGSDIAVGCLRFDRQGCFNRGRLWVCEPGGLRLVAQVVAWNVRWWSGMLGFRRAVRSLSGVCWGIEC